MKMTDAEAFDFLTPKDGPTIEQEAAIEHLRASLAADQQKGGGEVDRERTLTAARFRAACYALKEAVEGASGEVWRSESGDRLKDRAEWVAFYNLTSNMRERGGPDPYATPQPSIPAPAQQVDDEAVAADNYRWLRCGGWEVLQDPKYWRPEYGFDGAIAAARADVATNAALAHPPHADQETQG